MSKFYVYDNATRKLRSGRYTFVFDVVEPFGGSWRGVLKLDNEEQIKVLEDFATRLGVKAISEEEYNRLLKKKLNSPKSSPDPIRLPVSRLAVDAGRVVIKDPSGQITSDHGTPAPVIVKPSVEEAVQIGIAPFVDPLETRSNKRGKKKQG